MEKQSFEKVHLAMYRGVTPIGLLLIAGIIAAVVIYGDGGAAALFSRSSHYILIGIGIPVVIFSLVVLPRREWWPSWREFVSIVAVISLFFTGFIGLLSAMVLYLPEKLASWGFFIVFAILIFDVFSNRHSLSRAFRFIHTRLLGGPAL